MAVQYPEHEKLRDAKIKREAIEHFLNRVDQDDGLLLRSSDPNKQADTSQYPPLLDRYFDINVNKLLEERQQIKGFLSLSDDHAHRNGLA